jgi:hypothetical protein
MRPWTPALAAMVAACLAAFGAARTFAGEDRLWPFRGEPAAPAELLAWPVQPDQDVIAPATVAAPSSQPLESVGPQPPRPAPANPLILPRTFAPQPVHQLRPAERVALKPWPVVPPADPRRSTGSPPPLPQALASLPSRGADIPARPKLAPPIIIRGDDGGWLQTYYLRFHAQVENGATFRIDGRCASACTLVLAYPDRVCPTKRAVLGFHAARNRNGTLNQKVTDAMMTEYPAPVLEYIAAHGGLPGPSSVMWVSGPALRGLVMPCE